MTTRFEYDDCAAAMATKTESEPAITLSGYQASAIAEALRAADDALRRAETTKQWTIKRAALSARPVVGNAWAIIEKARSDAKALSGRLPERESESAKQRALP